MAQTRTVYLVDGTSQLYRAYFALPPMNNADGLPTQAVYGFTNMLRKLLNEHEPQCMAVAFDPPGRSFRAQQYKDYKANRPPTPPDMKAQAPYARDVCRVLGIPVIELPGYEADDVIATWVRVAREHDCEVAVVGSDKDLFQLVQDGVRVFNPTKEIWLDADGVAREFGVPPEHVLDVQGLAGDSVDNIPGVPGVGEKSAVSIVGTYGDLDTVIARASRFVETLDVRDAWIETLDALDKEPQATAGTVRRLQETAEQLDAALGTCIEVEQDADYRGRLETARRELADAPLSAAVEQVGETGRKVARPLKALKRELKSLDKGSSRKQWIAIRDHAEQARLSKRLATLRSDVPVETELDALTLPGPDREKAYELFRMLDFRAWISEFREGAPSPSAPVAPDDAGTPATATETITSADALDRLAATLREAGTFSVIAFGTEGDPLRGSLVGLALSGGDRTAYVPLGHAYLGVPDMLGVERVAGVLRALFADAGRPKTGHDLKRTAHLLRRAGMPLEGWGLDTMLAGFLIDASRPDYGLQRLAREYLGVELPPFDELVGSGAKRIPPIEIEIEAFAGWATAAAGTVRRLAAELERKLEHNALSDLYATIDGPLLPVLARMEAHGIRIDTDVLAKMSSEMARETDRIRGEIHALAGTEFNVDSPKQLREVLFEQMGLKPKRKTAKSRVASTDAQTLEELADEHEIARKLLEYRELTKLQGTYVDALPRLVNPETGRVHTSFHATGAATGRLSSSDPNLQNIPVRSEVGRRIRAAFVADEGHVFLAADYSQVELRVLAHLCDDAGLKSAFAAGEDIHRYTAAKVAGVMTDLVTDTMRRRAKAVNFGLLYGMSETRLAREQGMTRSEARDFVKTYFDRFANVRDYIERIREEALRDGEVHTLFGRVRRFPQLHERVHRGIQEQALRAAVNTTIQGTAADLMKLAMLRVERVLGERGLGARILLQVHDELLLEVPDAELETTREVVREAMEEVHPLEVPLVVDQKSGRNWYELG